MIEFSGIEFRHVDNRVMSLKLVQLGLSGAAMFGAHGEVLQPLKAGDPSWQEMVPPEIAEVIRKRGLLGYHPSAIDRSDDSRTANRAN